MTFDRSQFKKQLFKCHTIIRNNDKLSPDGAFDQISRILFLKNRFEKKNGKTFSMEEFKKADGLYRKTITPGNANTQDTFINHMFDEIKKEFKDHRLFDENDNISLKHGSIEQIIGELEIHNFTEIQDDVKGIAYEELLKKSFRKDLGQFFTPRVIVDFMVDILAPFAGERVCDPCCGSGGFLIKALQFMRATSKPGKAKKRHMNDFIVNHCIFGTEANPRMALTAKLNMIMHGDGQGGMHHHDGLLDTKDIFENSFDVVLTNPPFGTRLTREHTVTESGHKHIGTPIRNRYDLGRNTGLSEVLFMERCLRLLRPGGRMGIVLPDSVTNSHRHRKVRDYFEARAKLLFIVSLPRDVFRSSGTPVKTSLVFMQKFSADETNHYSAILKKVTAKIEKKKRTKEFCHEDTRMDTREKMAEEIKQGVKKLFNYKIPMAYIEKAGITSSGEPCENQLPTLAEEFRLYKAKAKKIKEKRIKR